MIKKCQKCGAEFKVRGKERIKNAKFCSTKCYYSSGMKRGERKPELRNNCKLCGKRFLPTSQQREKGQGNYCSRECYESTINSDTKYKCDYCEKEFTRKKFKFRKGTTKFYCCVDCRNKANRGENYNPNRIDYRDGQYKKLSKKLRDEAKCCEDCEKSVEKYQVHHVIPPWLFDDRKEAHKVKNLVVLCKKCHRKRHSKMMKFFFDSFRKFCKEDKAIKKYIIKNWNS